MSSALIWLKLRERRLQSAMTRCCNAKTSMGPSFPAHGPPSSGSTSRGADSTVCVCLDTPNTARSRLPATIARKQARCKTPSSDGFARRSRPYASHACHGQACDAIASHVCPFSCHSAHVRTLLSGSTKRGDTPRWGPHAGPHGDTPASMAARVFPVVSAAWIPMHRCLFTQVVGVRDRRRSLRKHERADPTTQPGNATLQRASTYTWRIPCGAEANGSPYGGSTRAAAPCASSP